MNAHPQASNRARVTARRSVLTGALLLGSAGTAHAQPRPADSTRTVSFGGFVDAAYAYDMNRPAGRDRAFTTQPARHNEFNINLAFIEAKLLSGRVRGISGHERTLDRRRHLLLELWHGRLDESR